MFVNNNQTIVGTNKYGKQYKNAVGQSLLLGFKVEDVPNRDYGFRGFQAFVTMRKFRQYIQQNKFYPFNFSEGYNPEWAYQGCINGSHLYTRNCKNGICCEKEEKHIRKFEHQRYLITGIFNTF